MTARVAFSTALAFGVVVFGLHVDIGVDHVGIVFEVVRVFQDILVAIVIHHLDIHSSGSTATGLTTFFDLFRQRRGALQARLFGRLLGAAFRADRRVLAKVEKPRPAGYACMFFTEFRFRHHTLFYHAHQGRRDAMP